MKKSLTTCNPCVAFSQMRRFSYGDAVRVIQPDAGLEMGRVLPILGYSRTKEGTNIIVEGNMPKNLREACLQPESTKEEFFKVLPARIWEIPVTTAKEYLEYIPANAAAIMTVSYNAIDDPFRDGAPLSNAA